MKKTPSLIAGILFFILSGICLAFALFPIPFFAAYQNVVTSFNPADPDRTESGNYLENGGFEGDTNELVHRPTDKAYIIGSLANGWQDNSWVTSDLTVHYVLDSSVRHGGNTSQRIEVQKQVKGHVTFMQNRHLLVGRYAAGIWLRSTDRVPIKVTLRGAGIKESTFPSKKILSSDQWQRVELSGLVSEPCRASFMVEILKPTTVWVDDAAIDTVSNFALKVLAAALVLLALGTALIVSRIKSAQRDAVQASMVYANGVPKNDQTAHRASDVAVKERE